MQIGLEGEKNDRPDILKYQDAEGDAPGQGRELEFVVEQLDDDQRAAERQSHGQIEPVEVGATQREAHEGRQGYAEPDTQKELADADDQQCPPGAGELSEIDLES